VHDLWARARLRLASLEKLAAADAFRSVQAELGFAKTGLDRRQALWEVKALGAAEPLPLFAWSETREAAAEPFVQLPEMRLSEHVVNDYQTLRLSLKAHPMSFLRTHLNGLGRTAPPTSFRRRPGSTTPRQEGAETCVDPALQRDDGKGVVPKAASSPPRIYACDELRGVKDGAYVAVAGVVLVRQRPGSAKGVVFMTIEDETGIANAVVWAKTLERFRKEVMGARLIVIHGRVQRHEDIIHVVAVRMEDRSDWLQLLSAEAADMQVPVANADHVRHPDIRSEQSGLQNGHPRWATHPRNARVIPPSEARIVPKSRDFH
jgi:error-prone DNA polymerase